MSETKKFAIRCRGIILHEGKLLVVKSPGANFYVLPGGHLEWGEDIKDCFHREIMEELGVSPKIGRLLYINNFVNQDEVQSIEFFFEILNSTEYIHNIENTERSHAHEIAELCWLSPDDMGILLPKVLHEDFKLGKILSDEIRYIHSK